MSHYTKCKTKITDKAALLEALHDMGFSAKQLKVYEQPHNLEGYQGDKRADTAEIIIPRIHVGGAANDVGFKLQEDGTWGAIVSDYDRSSGFASRKSQHAKDSKCRGYDALWLKKLNQRYAYHKVKESISNQGFFIESESDENGEIVLKINADSFGG